MRKNNAFVAKIANTHLTKICVAISERLSTSATLGLADNGGPQILWSRRRAQRRGDFFQAISYHCIVLLQFVPIVPFQLQKLSDAMYLDDKEEGMAVFREVFVFLKMPPEDLVSWAPIEIIFVLTILTLFVDQVFDFLKMPREDPDNPEKVRSVILDFSLMLSLSINQVSSTTINENGSVIQDAVRGGKIDFLRLLLEHGCDL